MPLCCLFCCNCPGREAASQMSQTSSSNLAANRFANYRPDTLSLEAPRAKSAIPKETPPVPWTPSPTFPSTRTRYVPHSPSQRCRSRVRTETQRAPPTNEKARASFVITGRLGTCSAVRHQQRYPLSGAVHCASQTGTASTDAHPHYCTRSSDRQDPKTTI